MVDQAAAKNGVVERRSMVENVQHWVVINKETKDAAYTYLHKATNALAYIPLAIMALPVVALAMLAAANVGIFVLFPLAVWWGAFAYWFPERAQQVLDFLKRTWALLKEYYAEAVDLLTWAYNHREEAYAKAKEYITSLFTRSSKPEAAADAEPKAVGLVSSYYQQFSELARSYYKQASELVLAYHSKVVDFFARVYYAAKDFFLNFFTYFFTFILRVRETLRALAWDNLRTPSTYNGEQLAPFFPELIDSTAEFLAGGSKAIPQPAHIKSLLAQYLPERVTRNIKDF